MPTLSLNAALRTTVVSTSDTGLGWVVHVIEYSEI